jgi:hypothetical protein
VDDFDQLLGSLGAWVVGGALRANHMVADMVLHDFRDEPVESAAAGRRLLQNGRAARFFLEGAFYRL